MESDSSLRKRRKIKLGLLVSIAFVIVVATIAVSVVYANAWALLTVLCVIVGPIFVAMCYQDHEETFASDDNLLAEIIKGIGYVLLVTAMTMAFGTPLILLHQDKIGPDMFFWTGWIAFAGGICDVLIVYTLFAGF